MIAPSGVTPRTAVHSERSVALTFDDLPLSGGGCEPTAAREVNRRILDGLARASAPATGFVNAGRTCGAPAGELRDEILEAWLDAGQDLGNHTWSHPDLVRISLDAYLEDVRKGGAAVDSLLRQRGRRLVWFRHPFLHAGDTAAKKAGLAEFLAAHGWRVAPVTVDNQEWMYAFVYQRALERGDSALAHQVTSAYFDHIEDAFAYFEERSREVLGREIPQVLLLHANRLNADHMGPLLDRIRARGYRFIPLEDALSDAAYAADDPYIGRGGPSWIERWAVVGGGEARQGPREHGWVAELYDRLSAR